MVWPNDCQTQSGKTWLGSVIDKQLQVEKFNLKLNKKKATSRKLQASSLTGPVGDDRMNLERNNYGKNNNRLQSSRTYEKNSRRPGGDPSTSEGRSGEDEKDKR